MQEYQRGKGAISTTGLLAMKNAATSNGGRKRRFSFHQTAARQASPHHTIASVNDKAARTMALDWCGYSACHRGPLVMEVVASPGLGRQKTTGIDIIASK